MRRLAPLLLAGCLAACVTESLDRPVGLDQSAPTLSRAVEAWEVVEAGRVVGTVVVFEVQGTGERFFQVRNPHQQELGMVDAEGRWWRYAPASPEPEWLGTGTVRDGVCLLLGAAPDAPFYDVPVATLRAEADVRAASASQN